MRVNKAIEDGSFFENPALRGGVRARRATSTCSASSRTAASTRTSTTCARCSASRREKTWIHAFTDGRDVSPHAAVHDLAELPRRADRDRRRAATTRWTATSAGSGPSARSTRSSARSPSRGRTPSRTCRQQYDAGVTDEFIEPVALRGPAGDRARRLGDLLQLPPGPGAAALAEAARGRARPDDDDALPRRPRLPGRLRGAGRRGHDRRGPRRARRPPAPLRRDREVRARHVLLQRRPRGGVAGRDADPRPVAARRRRPTTRSRRCRRRRWPSASPPRSGDGYRFADRQLREPGHGRAHRARSRPWSTAVETTDRCLGQVVDAVEAAGGVALVTADHGNAETMLAEDGVSPHTAHTTNPVPLVVTAPGRRAARGRRARRPRADVPRPARPRPAGGDDRASRRHQH